MPPAFLFAAVPTSTASTKVGPCPSRCLPPRRVVAPSFVIVLVGEGRVPLNRTRRVRRGANLRRAERPNTEAGPEPEALADLLDAAVEYAGADFTAQWERLNVDEGGLGGDEGLCGGQNVGGGVHEDLHKISAIVQSHCDRSNLRFFFR